MPRRGSSCSAEPAPRSAAGDRSRPVGLVGRIVGSLAALALLVVAVVAPGTAGAESPLVVAEDLAIDGVYVAPGRDLDEVAVAESIRQARARGLRLVVVAPNDPQPGPEAFARRVLEASDADAALVFPTEGGVEAHVIDELESASLRALGAARSKSNPVAAVEAFTDELLAEPSRSLPPIVGQLIRWVLFLAIVLAAAVAIEQLLRRMFGRRRAAGPRGGATMATAGSSTGHPPSSLGGPGTNGHQAAGQSGDAVGARRPH